MLALLQFPALIIVPSVLLFCILSIVHGDYEIKYSVDTTQPVHLPSNQRQGDHDLQLLIGQVAPTQYSIRVKSVIGAFHHSHIQHNHDFLTSEITNEKRTN